jgi:hypothetical protein
MSAAVVEPSSSSSHVTTPPVITSLTRVAFGSRLSASTRTTRSRSVTTPMICS